MLSRLVLNSPWRGTGNQARWTFTGADERQLRALLDGLDEFRTDDADDRWSAALVFYYVDTLTPPDPLGAWNIHGARRLAELLPESLADVREDLLNRFRDDPLLERFAERVGL